MSKVILYSNDLSPPCRAVLMTAQAIELPLEIREINLLKGEHLSEEFRKVNPQHTIPTLDDNGFVLPDSHAIITYLVDKYAKNDALYPKDLQKRALVNQCLHIDSGILFPPAKAAIKPILIDGAKNVPEDKLVALKKAFKYMDELLEGKEYLVGDSYTLADISCVTTVLGISIVLNIDAYPSVKAWLERCEQTLPGYKTVNLPGHMEYKAKIQSCLS